MKTKYLLAVGVASLATATLFPQAAFAQSTGSVDFDENEIIVTGAFSQSVGGVAIPDSPKAKQVLDEEAIRRQRPGQTINDIVNLVPGVSFQNNDPWGSSGGGFTIRGFTSDRISQTVDGIPLNDSGNYALYTNQQVDPEVLESVNVNLGVTDVDSPTASAVGGTINIRTRVPGDEMGIVMTTTYGDVLASGKPDARPYKRAFVMLDTGEFTSIGTKAFISGSYTTYENPYNNYGKVKKLQTNGRIYQPISDNGDFISVSGHYNQNRNNFFGSVSLTAFPTTRADRFYDINFPCTTSEARAGVADRPNGCGTEFDRRFNPSNTGNIRGASRFTLTDGLVLTVDPSFQYVKANGGGTSTGFESARSVNGTPLFGYISGRPYAGVDLNGDGDTLDQVTVLTPSQTRTRRYGVISNLSYEINPDHSVRVSYTHDYANHRQTGEVGVLLGDGTPQDVFPVNAGLVDANGNTLEKRDRQSFAILDQVSGEYRGRFGPVTAVVGLRAPFFTRELHQYCFTTSASGFVDCFGNDPTANAAYAAANPSAVAPVARTYKYDKLLPNLGFTVDIGAPSLFFNYAKGLSVPGTDPLYNSLYFGNAASAQPSPETTDSFDLGLRFRSGQFQGQIAGWLTKYNNRLASAYDPILDQVVYRNLGKVDKYGVDASLSWRPTGNTLLYVFGSINESEIKDDVQLTSSTYAPTSGMHESGAPLWSVGARGQIAFGDFELGAQVKHTGKRYVNDINTASVEGYTLVDLDLRYNVMELATGGNLAVQVNVSNLFDELFVGYFGGGITSTSPFVQIGAPRAASISLIAGF